MTDNKNSKKIIKYFNSNKILAVFSSNNVDGRFFYRIPISLNKRKIDLLQSIDKVQIICQNKNTFRNAFESKFYNNVSNYKSYDQNNQSNILKNLIQSNIFYEYGIKSKNSNDLLFNHSFDVSNFLNKESEIDSNSNVYYINLSDIFSSKIANNQIKNLRVMLLDDKNNIIDETGILECDFRKIKRTKKLVDDKIFYQNYFLNSFSNNLNFSINKNCKDISIVSSSIIDEKMFDSFDVKLTYLNNAKNISCSGEKINFEKNKFSLTNDVESFCFKVAEDYFLGLESYNFKITIDLYIKNKLEVKELPKSSKSLTLFKEISFLKENRFIRLCADFFRNRYFSQTIKRLQLTQSIDVQKNNAVFNKVSISGNIQEDVLKNIVINDIKLNKNSIENKIYSYKDFVLENILRFKGKSIFEAFENNIFEFYCRTSNREVYFDIEVQYLGKKYNFVSEKIVNKSDYESSVKKANKITKSNLLVSSVKVNTEISESNRSIFDIGNITLTNLRSYNDIAYSLGYILNSQGDIKSFLSNCIVKIENITKLFELDLQVNKTNYFFFEELFNMQEFQSGTVSINKSYIEKFIKTDEFFALMNLNKSNINKNIIDFFLLPNNVQSFRMISKEKSLSIENLINLKILPIPEIVSSYRGYDLDSLGNPIDSETYEDIENLNLIKRRLMRELVVYLYTSNPNLNWQKFNRYKEILMSREKSLLVSNYSEFFDDIVFLSMNEKDYFSSNFKYDKNEIMSFQNIDDLYLNSSLQSDSIEEDFTKKYFNFSLSNREFFIDNFPYSINFSNTSYVSTDNKYKIKNLDLIKSESLGQIKIDISNLVNIYEKNQVKEAKYYVRCSLHFLMKNKEENLNNLSVDQTKFIKSNYGGKDCLTYNLNYVNEMPSAFSNLKNTLDQTNLNCVVEGEKIYLVISDYNSSLDIDKLNYSFFAEFFDFCNSNNVNHLLDVVLRTSISANLPDTDDFIFGVISHKIPFISLSDQNLSFENLSKINSIIVT